uniref:FIST_C domain-containing protein n=1 Tax=Macrostomum lignano TaxID=282301 RepID=A0A1I8FK65_9PLAT
MLSWPSGFGLLLTELRADWHPAVSAVGLLRCRISQSQARRHGWRDGRGRAWVRRLPNGAGGGSRRSTESAGRGSSHLQALKAFAAAELPPGARLHLAGSFAGAIGTPEGAAGVPVEMETGKSSDVRQMHGLAHVRLYTCPGDDPRRFGVASAGEPLPPGASAEAAAGLAKQKRQPPFGAGQPERRLLAEHPDMIAAGATDEAGSDAGIDHSRLVFYGDRLRVLSAMVTDAEDLERTLRSLKLSSLQPLLPGQCLGLHVHLLRQGQQALLGPAGHRDRRVQSLLPGVPVLGLFSEGEFSRNCSPGERFADVPSPPLGLRAYRTSLCVLSWSKGPPDPKCHSRSSSPVIRSVKFIP